MALNNPASGNAPALRDKIDFKLMDAIDFLTYARDLVNLIGLSCTGHSDDRQRAIAAGCEMVLGRIEMGLDEITNARQELRQ